MGPFANLTPTQRKLALFGAAAVVVLAVGLRIGRGGKDSTPADAPTSSTGPTAGGLLAPITSGGATDVLGVGQLADFESVVTGALGGLADAVKALADKEPAAPTTTPSTTAPIWPAHSPLPVNAACPAGRKVGYVFNGHWTCWTPAEEYGVLTSLGG